MATYSSSYTATNGSSVPFTVGAGNFVVATYTCSNANGVNTSASVVAWYGPGDSVASTLTVQNAGTTAVYSLIGHVEFSKS